MKTKKILTTFLFLILSWNGFSQVKHGAFYGNFVLRSNSVLPAYFNGVTMSIYSQVAEKPYSFTGRYLLISPEYDIHVPSWTMNDATGNIPTQGPYWWRCLLIGDFSHNYNFAIGYDFTYRSYDIPLSLKFGANYEWRGLYIKEGDLYGLHRIEAIVPKALLQWHVLGIDYELEHLWNIVVEIGAAHPIHTKYSDPYSLGFDTISDGWRGIASVGVKYNFSLFSIRYERDLYNYFTIPNISTRLGNLVFAFSIQL